MLALSLLTAQSTHDSRLVSTVSPSCRLPHLSTRRHGPFTLPPRLPMDDAGEPGSTDASMARNPCRCAQCGSGGARCPSRHCPDHGHDGVEAAMRNPRDPIAEMHAANRALKREMLRDLEQMSRRQLLRRGGSSWRGRPPPASCSKPVSRSTPARRRRRRRCRSTTAFPRISKAPARSASSRGAAPSRTPSARPTSCPSRS